MTDKITAFNAKEFLETAPTTSGVYRMFDADNTIIYVGKAKNLKNRLSSYFRTNLDRKKTENLVKHIHNIELTVTQTETEALILEHNYIKRYQPKYNVLLRDDKSYPYIFLSNEKHPRISLFRGAKNKKGEYFGPYPNQSAVRETLSLLQKLFPIRQCEDSVYRNRLRPCLQYQIKRCLAPCVEGLVSEQEYQENVNYIRLFLSGKDEQVVQHLVRRMEDASIKLEFERAAKLRDLIQSIRHITAQQSVDGNLHDLDVIGFAHKNNIASLHILFIRQGKVLGSRNYFPKIPLNTDKQEIIETFIGQFYLEGNQARTLPQEIILDANLKNSHFITEVLTQFAGRKIAIHCQVRGEKARYAKLATLNAKSALVSKLMQQSTTEQRFAELEGALAIPSIQRMECFDISHHQGEQTVASCVVFDREGPLRSQYRRYLINGITPGDDYAAMKQVLTRRYTKSLPEDNVPDVILIDGGKGQLAQAIHVFDTLDVDWDKNKPLLLGVAKGEERKAGLETLFFESVGNGVTLPSNSLALHLIQHIRDEAHDHAISGHRKRLVKVKTHSTLEDIEGIGPKRRQQLLKHMGGLKPLMQASPEDIAKVPGISLKLAQKIHDALKH